MFRYLLEWIKRSFSKFFNFFLEVEKGYCLKIPREVYEEALIIAKKNNVSVLKVFRAFFKVGFIVDAIYSQGCRVLLEDEEGEQRTLVLFTETEGNIDGSNLIDFKKIKRRRKKK